MALLASPVLVVGNARGQIPGPSCPVDPNGQVLSQSLSQTIISGNGIACTKSGPPFPRPTYDNWFARSYDLSTDPGTAGRDVNVTCVEIGIDSNGSVNCPARISIYEDTNGGAPQGPGIDLNLLGSQDFMVPANASLEKFGVVFGTAVAVPADTRMVVEMFVADTGSTSGVFPGTNRSGQTGPTYVRAYGCNVPTYVNLASLGFPNSHWVQNVSLVFPQCPADITGDGVVDVLDLLELLANWGPCPGCPADITGPTGVPDGVVDVLDLLELLANWGPCP